MSDTSKLMLKTIPELPGVYQFLNKNKKIIYVEKQLILKKSKIIFSKYKISKNHKSG